MELVGGYPKDFKRRDIIHFNRDFCPVRQTPIHLFTGFCQGQCFGLREEIRQQFTVMIPSGLRATGAGAIKSHGISLVP